MCLHQTEQLTSGSLHRNNNYCYKIFDSEKVLQLNFCSIPSVKSWVRPFSHGQIPYSFLKQLILQFYFQSTKLTFLFNFKQSKVLNKYFKRYFLEIQVLKYTELQEKVGVFADDKIMGKRVLLNSLHPPSLPKNSGRCWQRVIVQRYICALKLHNGTWQCWLL